MPPNAEPSLVSSLEAAVLVAAGLVAGFAAAVLAGAFVAAAAFTVLGLASAFVAAALDFAAGFGLETAEAAFAAGFVSDGALAINSPTPRWTRACDPSPHWRFVIITVFEKCPNPQFR